ncbi:hypothetical protein ABTB86_19865, partial [Acinetobacter baumannii]
HCTADALMFHSKFFKFVSNVHTTIFRFEDKGFYPYNSSMMSKSVQTVGNRQKGRGRIGLRWKVEAESDKL